MFNRILVDVVPMLGKVMPEFFDNVKAGELTLNLMSQADT